MCYYYVDKNNIVLAQKFYNWLVDTHSDKFLTSVNIHERIYHDYFDKLEKGENVDNYFEELQKEYISTKLL